MIWSFVCWILGHKMEHVVETWTTHGWCHSKKKGAHRKHRRAFERCKRCGKEIEE